MDKNKAGNLGKTPVSPQKQGFGSSTSSTGNLGSASKTDLGNLSKSKKGVDDIEKKQRDKMPESYGKTGFGSSIQTDSKAERKPDIKSENKAENDAGKSTEKDDKKAVPPRDEEEENVA